MFVRLYFTSEKYPGSFLTQGRFAVGAAPACSPSGDELMLSMLFFLTFQLFYEVCALIKTSSETRKILSYWFQCSFNFPFLGTWC